MLKYKIAKSLGLIKPVVIPSMEAKRAVIEKYRAQYSPVNFIESGTFWGDTIEFFKNQFQKLYSIELSADLAAKARARFAGETKIEIIQGDSGKILNELLPQLQGTSLFWLDGHYSSEFFVGDEFIKTAKGDKNTPIEEELLAVCKNTTGPQLVFIDDARLFTGREDYPTVQKIKELINLFHRPYTLEVELDMIRIILN